MDCHEPVRGRGGVLAVMYKTHWAGLTKPSREQEMDLLLYRPNILRCWAGKPDQHRRTNPLHHRMRIGTAQCAIYMNNNERCLTPGYACVSRAE